LWGGFANAGQICASVERVYAVEPVYQKLVEKVAERASKLRVGPPTDAAVDVGSMTFPRQKQIVEELVLDAKQKGARVLAGGGPPPGSSRGLFYQPTVLADCTHDMNVMKAEIFGPVVPFMKVSSEEEAIRLANDSHLGLGAYVFTQDKQRGRSVAERLMVGSVMINDVIMHAGMAEMPWGGIKQSGLGVVRSDRGLRELCLARHINEDRLPVSMPRDPYWFPYASKGPEVVRKVLNSMFGGSLGSKLLRVFLR
jgi:succinate-semialdehyde dehydrogenase/glutarate-semialdehyde dehydrogenase